MSRRPRLMFRSRLVNLVLKLFASRRIVWLAAPYGFGKTGLIKNLEQLFELHDQHDAFDVLSQKSQVFLRTNPRLISVKSTIRRKARYDLKNIVEQICLRAGADHSVVVVFDDLTQAEACYLVKHQRDMTRLLEDCNAFMLVASISPFAANALGEQGFIELSKSMTSSVLPRATKQITLFDDDSFCTFALVGAEHFLLTPQEFYEAQRTFKLEVLFQAESMETRVFGSLRALSNDRTRTLKKPEEPHRREHERIVERIVQSVLLHVKDPVAKTIVLALLVGEGRVDELQELIGELAPHAKFGDDFLIDSKGGSDIKSDFASGRPSQDIIGILVHYGLALETSASQCYRTFVVHPDLQPLLFAQIATHYRETLSYALHALLRCGKSARATHIAVSMNSSRDLIQQFKGAPEALIAGGLLARVKPSLDLIQQGDSHDEPVSLLELQSHRDGRYALLLASFFKGRHDVARMMTISLELEQTRYSAQHRVVMAGLKRWYDTMLAIERTGLALAVEGCEQAIYVQQDTSLIARAQQLFIALVTGGASDQCLKDVEQAFLRSKGHFLAKIIAWYFIYQGIAATNHQYCCGNLLLIIRSELHDAPPMYAHVLALLELVLEMHLGVMDAEGTRSALRHITELREQGMGWIVSWFVAPYLNALVAHGVDVTEQLEGLNLRAQALNESSMIWEAWAQISYTARVCLLKRPQNALAPLEDVLKRLDGRQLGELWLARLLRVAHTAVLVRLGDNEVLDRRFTELSDTTKNDAPDMLEVIEQLLVCEAVEEHELKARIAQQHQRMLCSPQAVIWVRMIEQIAERDLVESQSDAINLVVSGRAAGSLMASYAAAGDFAMGSSASSEFASQVPAVQAAVAQALSNVCRVTHPRQGEVYALASAHASHHGRYGVDQLQGGSLYPTFRDRASLRLVPKEAPMLRVCLLGQFKVSYAGRDLPEQVWRRRKGKMILMLLALNLGRQVESAQLIDQLWPGVDERKAANSLYVSLTRIREALRSCGCEIKLSLAQGVLSLDPTLVTCDVFELEHECRMVHELVGRVRELSAGELITNRRAEVSQSLKKIHRHAARILSLYTGDLVIDEDPDHIISSRRIYIKSRFIDTLLEIAQLMSEQLDTEQALFYVRAARGHEPMLEQAIYLEMQLLLTQMRRPEAIDLYLHYSEYVRERYGIDPDERLVRLYHKSIGTSVSVGA